MGGMLVLSRRVGETVSIGRSQVKVLGVEGKKVRLGVLAAPDLRIRRGPPEPPPAEPGLPRMGT